MPRKSSNKPWLHSGSGFWCIWIDGKRVYLDKDYKSAYHKLRAIKADQKRQAEGNREWMDVPFAILQPTTAPHLGLLIGKSWLAVDSSYSRVVVFASLGPNK